MLGHDAFKPKPFPLYVEVCAPSQLSLTLIHWGTMKSLRDGFRPGKIFQGKDPGSLHYGHFPSPASEPGKNVRNYGGLGIFLENVE